MADYNFTVRATDNVGAFSDRAFTISVTNSSVERFVAVGSSGLAHSATGVTAASWTLEAGLTGTGVDYLNGRWVVWYGTVTSGLRTSLDAFNWSSYNIVWPATTIVGNAVTFNAIQRVKYKKGAYYLWVQGSTSANQYALEMTSSDLVNWTSTGRYLTGVSTTTAVNVNDFEYDATSDTWVVEYGCNGSHYIYSRTGTNSFALVVSYATSYIAGNGAITFLNGLWCAVAGGTATTGVYTSIDGVNWTARTTIASTTLNVNGLTYANGRLIATLQPQSTNSAVSQLIYSTNGGRTWQSGASPAGYSQNNVIRQPLAYYGGTTIINSSQNYSVAYSIDGGGSVTTIALPSGVSYVQAVAARTT